MVSRDTKETALLVALGVACFLVARVLNAPDVVAWGVLIGVGGVAPLLRDEWRRRQSA